jgi:hypothetical protein
MLPPDTITPSADGLINGGGPAGLPQRARGHGNIIPSKYSTMVNIETETPTTYILPSFNHAKPSKFVRLRPKISAYSRGRKLSR